MDITGDALTLLIQSVDLFELMHLANLARPPMEAQGRHRQQKPSGHEIKPGGLIEKGHEVKGNHRPALGPDAVMVAGFYFKSVIAGTQVGKIGFAARRGVNPMVVQAQQTILKASFFRSDKRVRCITKLQHARAAWTQLPEG